MTDEPIPEPDPLRWEKRYIANDLPWDSGTPDPHLVEFVGSRGPGRGAALEIGCGTGTNSIWLAEQGFDVTGVDVSPTAVELARAKAAEIGAKCRLEVTDFLTDPPAGGPFDFAYDRGCFHSFERPDDQRRFAAALADLLAPDGVWHSLIGSTDGGLRECAGPPQRSAATVTAAVEPWFEILELRATHFGGLDINARAWILVARRREP